jgi:asparagine synthetase B (glutamine-hydrolysing)
MQPNRRYCKGLASFIVDQCGQKSARIEQTVVVMTPGHGGDTVFGGYWLRWAVRLIDSGTARSLLRLVDLGQAMDLITTKCA